MKEGRGEKRNEGEEMWNIRFLPFYSTSSKICWLEEKQQRATPSYLRDIQSMK